MKRFVTTILLIGLIGLVGLITVYAAEDSFDSKDVLHRLSAEFQNFDGTETFTNETVPDNPEPGEGGLLAYSKEVYVPQDATLYVTISATGDTHGGAAAWFSCVVDDKRDKKDGYNKDGGEFCNPGSAGAGGAPGGWINLLKLPVASQGADNCNDGGGGAGDCHDNSIHYTWCTNVKKGNHTVDIRLASSEEPGEEDTTVFYEAAHFYIDATHANKDKCVQAGSTGYEGPNPHHQ